MSSPSEGSRGYQAIAARCSAVRRSRSGTSTGAPAASSNSSDEGAQRRRREQEGGDLPPRARPGIGAPIEQHADGRAAALATRRVQGGGAGAVAWVDAVAPNEALDPPHLALRRREVQVHRPRRHATPRHRSTSLRPREQRDHLVPHFPLRVLSRGDAVPVERLGIDAAIEQQPHELGVSPARRAVQQIPRATLGIERRVVVEEPGHGGPQADVSDGRAGGPAERRATITRPRAEVRALRDQALDPREIASQRRLVQRRGFGLTRHRHGQVPLASQARGPAARPP